MKFIYIMALLWLCCVFSTAQSSDDKGWSLLMRAFTVTQAPQEQWDFLPWISYSQDVHLGEYYHGSMELTLTEGAEFQLAQKDWGIFLHGGVGVHEYDGLAFHPEAGLGHRSFLGQFKYDFQFFPPVGEMLPQKHILSYETHFGFSYRFPIGVYVESVWANNAFSQFSSEESSSPWRTFSLGLNPNYYATPHMSVGGNLLYQYSLEGENLIPTIIFYTLYAL